MTNPRELLSGDLVRRLRHAAAAWFSNDQLLMLEELIRRLERAESFKDALLSRDFDAHDNAMEPLGSHNWEPPPFKRGR